MNDVVLGRILRALRRRRGWRQVDLAERSGASQSHISAIERGSAGASSLRTIRRVFDVLEGRAEVVVSWRGADLDRLLDEDHRELVGQVASRLEAIGWIAELEVTYSEYGERGSIDVLALRAAHRACLVIEVKSAIASSEAIGRKLDEKARLAPRIVERRSGWRPEVVGRIVVLPETMRLRRLIAREETLRRMFPAPMAEVRAWLRRPLGTVAGLWFLSDSSRHGVRGSRRVRVRAPSPTAAGSRAAEATSLAAISPAVPSIAPSVPSKTAGTATR
jgi:transcriptional regulator with XRE-family HTH domain